MFFIYIIVNSINNKYYVGKTNNLKRRWQEHKKVTRGGKEKYGKDFRVIHAAMKKHNINNFQIHILDEIENEKCAYEQEVLYIQLFDSKNKGYNESIGGTGFAAGENHPFYGKSPSEETKRKCHEARLKNKRVYPKGYTMSDEFKKQVSDRVKGEGNPMYGKTHSEETKKIMSEVKINNKNIHGENSYLAKLTNIQAAEIRQLFYENKIKKSEIAQKFNVRWDVIHKIIVGKTYKK